jgi:RNA polymerase sigma-70 factor (ECF subfamily)
VADSDGARAAYDTGRSRWPEIELTVKSFYAFIEARAVPAERLAARAEDLFLAAAAGRGDPPALEVFEADVLACARPAVRRYGDDDFVSEVLQRLRVHLLVAGDEPEPRVSRYDGRASLRSWVGVCAVRMALYTLRGERAQRSVGERWYEALADLPTGDPALDQVKGRYAAAFRDALVRASRELEPRQRAVLRMRFAHGATVDEIAATYTVHRVTAWRWLSGARDALVERALAALSEAIPDEVSLGSLMDLVRSRIELSVTGLFADDRESMTG